MYQKELDFLCDILARRHVRTTLLDPERIQPDGGELFPLQSYGGLPASALLPLREERTVYVLADDFDLEYLALALPQEMGGRLLLIGPYVRRPLSEEKTSEIGERAGIPPGEKKLLDEFLTRAPSIGENSALFATLDCFFERLWGSGRYTFSDLTAERGPVEMLPGESTQRERQGGPEVAMQVLENRYRIENEMIRAVAEGQSQQVLAVFEHFAGTPLERRSADPLRNLRNYCIIMNTLFRKAVESAGVHPFYIDSASSTFAHRIEQTPSTEACLEIMREMAEGYSRLVRKHKTGHLSPPVQKAILTIDADLSGDLSLRALAEAQGISPGHLCALFKKEAGKTLTAFVLHRRIKYAKHLLSSTHLQVQTVAAWCGILDVQYFSKLFKKHTGQTPKDYRASFLSHPSSQA